MPSTATWHGRRAQVTTIGMLLDPVADKLLIAAAFVTLVQFNPRIVPAWMVVIIVGREFLVSGLRSIAASEGLHHPGQRLGQAEDVCPDLHRRGRDYRSSLGVSPWYFLPAGASDRRWFRSG